MAGKKRRKTKDDDGKGAVHKALSHPIRTAIVRAIQLHGPSSPKRFSSSTKESDNEIDLNLASYHFRVLADFEVIELLDEIPRRGAKEHVYGINPTSAVPDLLRATDLLQMVMSEGGLARFDGGGLRLNGGQHGITILPVDVDVEGKDEVAQMMAGVRSSLKQISEACRLRSASEPERRTSMRIGIATYSPESSGTAPPQ